MDPVILTALVTAVGSQLVAVIKAARCQKETSASIGTPNGLGSVHDALRTIDGKLDGLTERVTVLEGR
jgi:hypothetical protein